MDAATVQQVRRFHRTVAERIGALDDRFLGRARPMAESRLLWEIEGQARSAGATVVRLETNRALQEAIALYRRSGYREVDAFNDEPYAHHRFERDLSACDAPLGARSGRRAAPVRPTGSRGRPSGGRGQAGR